MRALGISICSVILAAIVLSSNFGCAIMIFEKARIEYYDPAYPPPEVAKQLAKESGKNNPAANNSTSKEQGKATKVKLWGPSSPAPLTKEPLETTPKKD